MRCVTLTLCDVTVTRHLRSSCPFGRGGNRGPSRGSSCPALHGRWAESRDLQLGLPDSSTHTPHGEATCPRCHGPTQLLLTLPPSRQMMTEHLVPAPRSCTEGGFVDSRSVPVHKLLRFMVLRSDGDKEKVVLPGASASFRCVTGEHRLSGLCVLQVWGSESAVGVPGLRSR